MRVFAQSTFLRLNIPQTAGPLKHNSAIRNFRHLQFVVKKKEKIVASQKEERYGAS
jgi:hypothetical protein